MYWRSLSNCLLEWLEISTLTSLGSMAQVILNNKETKCFPQPPNFSSGSSFSHLTQKPGMNYWIHIKKIYNLDKDTWVLGLDGEKLEMLSRSKPWDMGTEAKGESAVLCAVLWVTSKLGSLKVKASSAPTNTQASVTLKVTSGSTGSNEFPVAWFPAHHRQLICVIILGNSFKWFNTSKKSCSRNKN